MRLHVGELYWPAVTNVKNDYSRKFDNLSDGEILIVGGGMSGMLSAYRLSKEGYKVSLIERNKIASGSSSANTGLIQYMSDKGVESFIEQIGEKDAKFFYDQSVNAVDILRQIDSDLDELDNITFEIRESQILATEDDKADDIKSETDKQQEYGYKAEYNSKEDLEEMDLEAYASLEAKPDIALNPFGFIYRMLYKAISDYDLQVYEDTEFVSIKSIDGTNVITVKNKDKTKEVKFNKIIFATGYDIPSILSEKLSKLQINKTYVTVSDDNYQVGNADEYLVWELKSPYTYFRKTFEDRFMIGGLDVEDSQLEEEDAYKNKDKLIEQAKKMIDKNNIDIDAEYSYAALFGESEDNLPFIGIDPDNDQIFVICGAGGNGTIYSTMASEMVLKWLNNEDLSEYDFLAIGR